MAIQGGPTDERVRELANEILSNPPFDAWNGATPDALQRFLHWLAGLFTWMDRIYEVSPALYWLFVAGLLVVAFALIAHIFYSTRAALRAPSPRRETPTAEVRPSWMTEARDLASDGRYVEATHRLALGSVQSLVTDGHIELDRSDANRILRNRIRSAALPTTLSIEFLELLDAFEARWFRDRTEDPQLYEAWCNLYARICRLPAPTR